MAKVSCDFLTLRFTWLVCVSMCVYSIFWYFLFSSFSTHSIFFAPIELYVEKLECGRLLAYMLRSYYENHLLLLLLSAYFNFYALADSK